VSFLNTTVANNTSVTGSAGLVLSVLITNDSALFIHNSTFTGNTGHARGAFALVDIGGKMSARPSIRVNLHIKECWFLQNAGQRAGSGFGIYDFVTLTESSLIEKSRFLKEPAWDLP